MKAVAITLALALVGCGTSLGFLRDSTTSQNFSYSMSVKTLSMQRTVAASVETKTIVCLIPTDGKPPYAAVMKRLHRKANLKPNEVLVNIREDKRVLTYLIYCKHRLTVSADIYLLGDSPPPKPSQEVEGGKKKEKRDCKKEYWSCVKECDSPDCSSKCASDKVKCEGGNGI